MNRPNFIFILIDDLGWKDVGCYGADPGLIGVAAAVVQLSTTGS